jgi:OOP family OmpA-OmpF porin
MNTLSKLGMAIVAGCLMGTPAIAAAAGYIGGGAGLADSSINGVEDSGAARIHAGYLWSTNYGFEVGYINFGDFDVENRPSGNTTEIDGAYVAVSGANRVGDNLELTGKLGAFHWEQNVTTNSRLVSVTDGTSAMLGIGVNYYFTEFAAIGAEYTLIDDVEDEHVNSYWLQLHIRFGE